ncbi:rhodanese-like domain-containing protein [Niabella drilacis]|uniref:Rhodanese-related sulfurtransferase n=1 Tax=Niabella drilacis (strain DSM 25811 / CCM 8410 / CCUG 62505 / LMG 26954 / E90) TaxID=1285928 RepID=A0A1G6MXP6_NIADE|nr:rhodanese-like domain-containing protein [Niabella drilacis]SDC60014.1 Rhodanese-related sulfurtransferase [Niabella drilacis]
MKTLALSDFLQAAENGPVILDTRPTELFKAGFIPGSIHVPFGAKQFDEWVAAVLEKETPVLLVAETGSFTGAEEGLKRLGYAVTGSLEGGFEAYQAAGSPLDMIIDVESDELMMDIPFDEHLIVMDVRKPIEYAEGHLKDAINLPLTDLRDPLRISAVEEKDNLYLHCGGGTRSVIAASVLKRQGLHNLRNVAGGWKKIKEEPRAEIVKEPGILN